MHAIETVREGIYCADAFYGGARRGAVYIIFDKGEAAIIDTGTALSVPYITDALQKLNIQPEQVRYILPTHVHLDHAGGAALLSRKLPNAQVIVHPRGLKHLIEPTKLIEGSTAVYGREVMETVIGKVIPLDADRGAMATDGMRLSLGSRNLHLIFSPGHAKHHYSVWDETEGCYFAGDVAGNSYREMDKDGRHLMFLCSAPVQYDPAEWHASLDKILELNTKCLCLCHYGVIESAGVRQAIADMQRLIAENNAAVMKYATINRQQTEDVVWKMFWQEYNRIAPAMSVAEAKEWMIKDVYIATGGLFHWHRQQHPTSRP